MTVDRISDHIVPAAALAAASVAFGAAAVWWDPSLAGLTVLAIATVLIVPFVIRVWKRSFDPFEPLFLFALAYGTMFVIRPAVTLQSGDLAYRRSYGTADISSTFQEMLVIALVGALALVAAYASPIGASFGRRIPVRRRSLDAQFAALLALGAATIASISFALYAVQTGGLEMTLQGRSVELTNATNRTSKYLVWGQFMLIPSCLLMLALGKRTRNSVVRAGGLFAFALAAFVATPLGSRGMLLSLVGGVIVYLYVSRGKRPSTRFLCLLGAFALVASAVTLVTRNANERESRGVGAAITNIVTNPENVIAPVTEGDDASMAPLLATALLIIPEDIPHMHGAAFFGDLLFRPIPRQLWPNKPIPPRERITSTLWPRSPFLNLEYSVLMIGYLDFGLLGVTTLMSILGIALRTLYVYFVRNALDLGAQLVFASTLPVVVSALRDGPVDTITRIVFVVVPLWLILRLAQRPTTTP